MTLFGTVIPRLPVVELTRTLDFYIGRLGFVVDVAWPDAEPTLSFCVGAKRVWGFSFPMSISLARQDMPSVGWLLSHVVAARGVILPVRTPRAFPI